MIPVYKPYLTNQAKIYANEALESTWISSNGKFLDLITDKLQDLLNVKHVLPVMNGTAAMHLVAKGLSYKTKCKNIYVPNNVFIAAINPFLYDKEYNLYSLDADKRTWNLDLKLLDIALSDIKPEDNFAVLIVHNIGNIINVPELKRKYPHVHFVEDNCEGLFGKYEGKYTGTESLISAVSFFGNKTITCGEGSVVMTNDSDVYEYIKLLRGQGQGSTRFVHEELGYNYRMTNVQAAILLSQLEALPEILDKKADIFYYYKMFCSASDRFKPQKIDPNTEMANWMFGVYFENSPGYFVVEKFFRERGIEIRPMFYPLSSHSHLVKSPYISLWDETVAKDLNNNCFILPSYPDLTATEVERILLTMQELEETF